MPFIRFDTYPKFEYAINPVNYFTTKIEGTSFGTNLVLKFPVSKNILIKTGIGFYKYRFSKIRNKNSLFGNSNSRTAEQYIPPGPFTPSLIFSSDKYWYNTITGLIGIENKIKLTKTTLLELSSHFINYYTFSQLYHITYPYPNGDNYKLKKGRYFGHSVELIGALKKNFGRSQIGPAILLPIYSYWKQDEFFPQESNNKGRNKWFQGGGLGISYSYKF